GLVHLRFSIGDDDERRAQGDERARPTRELSAQADVERAGDVARAELACGPHVEHYVTEVRVTDDLLRQEGNGSAYFVERLRALAVQFSVLRKVCGGLLQFRRQYADELVFGHGRERVV